jgi:hypothetical protein
LACGQLGVDELAIHRDLEAPAPGRNEFNRTDALFQLKELLRQTDGMWFVVSERAILNADFHRLLDHPR